jgi:hypothetical protein
MLLTAGCGGGSSKVSSTGAASSAGGSSNAATSTLKRPKLGESPAQLNGGPPPSPFAAKVRGICARLTTELEAHKILSPTPQQIVSIVPRRLALEKAGLAELRKLTPPASGASDWRQFMAVRQRVVEVLERLNTAVQTKNKAAEKHVLSSNGNLETSMTPAATRLGIRSCAFIV